LHTQHEAIIEAFKNLGGIRTAAEIEVWLTKKYGLRWVYYSTRMADMVPERLGGNSSSTVPDEFRVLTRISKGEYALIGDQDLLETRTAESRGIRETKQPKGPTSEQMEFGKFTDLLGELQRKGRISGEQFRQYRDRWLNNPLDRTTLIAQLEALR